MKRRKKYAGNRRGVQLVTLCISTAMVLVLLSVAVGKGKPYCDCYA